MKRIALVIMSGLLSLTAFDGMSQNKNKVIAHRGAWKNTGATENSIGALEHAIKLGCYGSEFDVHMSADSVLYVLHDHSIKGTHIEKTNSQELSQIKLENGESLPTLEAYLKAGLKQKKTRLILEIKTSSMGKERSLALATKCVEMVKKLKAEKITDYIAFDFDVCLKVKQLAPKAHVEYLNGDKTPDEIAAAGLDGIDYHFNVFKKKEEYISEMRKKKLTTNVWTVNDEAMLKWFLEKDVDFITTNEPELLLSLSK
ncbi:glycerophosphodiester phosphodiesterase family protein [Dyadobacter sp. CY323]|uniref:glycerophosphodiester phosphodiesterase n=1 Tax=Dyadobacter sp. CY323 TaxID=2907302 RepID=UPI001F21517C|nr:glycerophosphodiester phosphodiesterase family protein [Dyadobacter sp. CY323]MCE6989255.1 glycerophosphodiester phosphodiesterase [Dyadobacter sp. CY323]